MDREKVIRGQYKKTARRREDILDAAFTVFSKAGFSNGSMTEIARQADFTLPGLIYYFPTKEALFEAVVDRRDLGASSLLEGLEGADILDGLLDIVRRDHNDSASARMFAIISAEATEPAHPMHSYFQARYDLILTSATAAFESAQRIGEIRADTPAAEAAATYIALSDGLILQSLLRPGKIDPVQTMQRALQQMKTTPQERH